MKKCSNGIKILAVIYVAVVLTIIAATAVEAKEPTFKSLYVPEGEWHNGGHLFIVKGGVVQTGWTTYNFRNFRYSLKEHRRQEQVNGKWVSVGQQFYHDCMDMQK